ncbi:hypothetical protein F4861DRAFT_493882 [Xylaria intraflava]|nr:hypothetical protein F4861DRAFT_493882 [Xylaria intraflava]
MAPAGALCGCVFLGSFFLSWAPFFFWAPFFLGALFFSPSFALRGSDFLLLCTSFSSSFFGRAVRPGFRAFGCGCGCGYLLLSGLPLDSSSFFRLSSVLRC